VISVIGGLILVSGTYLLFISPGSSSNPTKAVRSQNDAVRGGTAAADLASPGASAVSTAPATPTGTPAPQRSYAAAPPFTIDPTATYLATIKTDKGDITIKLDPKSAPQTVNNFIFLAQNHFYDGLSFQKVLPDFVAQAGATQVDGSGGPGYTLPDENSSLPHDIGAVATAEQANTPNSSGSQFYVALKAVPQQDGKDTVFGKVIDGLTVLQQLPRRDPKDTSAPPPLTINTITIAQQ
jgi:cyclophilin family peptidyl-prolyl cis-trans isomerase